MAESFAGEQTLGQLTVSWLTRFIKNQLEQNPVTFLSQFGAEELVAQKRLTVADEVRFPKYDKVYYVGSTSGAPAFQSGFGNYHSSWARASYVKHPDGWVSLAGVVSGNTAAPAAIFNLPPGFRPELQEMFSMWSSAGAVRVDVQPNGQVITYNIFNGAPGSGGGTYLSLSGIHFKAA